jgi:SAM-dependent methyltransferase
MSPDSIMSLLGRRWKFYIRMRINNPITNLLLKPVEKSELKGIGGVEIRTLDISSTEYREFVGLDELKRYQGYDFAHSKVLEYLTSYKLLEINSNSTVLDAGGGFGRYVKSLKELKNPHKIYCIDPLDSSGTRDGVTFIKGSVSSINLPSGSLTSISCHHSFEHFRGNVDVEFIKEACRLLKAGGKTCIVPFFLCNRYSEIWNKIPEKKFDKNAYTIYSPLETFPGWGSYERFARVYDLKAVTTRLLPAIPEDIEVAVYNVLYEGKPCPDIKKNHHEPRLNSEMKALVLHKLQQ